MPDISRTFSAEATSLRNTFFTKYENPGFRIPIYQRGYRWNKENIERLFEDVILGIRYLKNENDSTRFIGTIILVNEKEKRERDFKGKSLAIVDGQQRLTTLSLLICEVLDRILIYADKIGDELKNRSDLSEELKITSQKLFECIAGGGGSFPTNAYDFFPKVVREEGDNRTDNPKDALYKSFIASYIFDFIRNYFDYQREKKYKERPSASSLNFDDPDADKFISALKNIRKQINELLESENSEGFTLPTAQEILNIQNYADILNVKIKFNISEASNDFIRIVFLANFILDRLSLTRVEVEHDKYAFDIFEALNTTGQPLTAIETFRPEVIKYEELSSSGYRNSDALRYFDEIEDYLKDFESTSGARETSEIIISFALYCYGKKESKHLSSQRKFLRHQYDQIKFSDNMQEHNIRKDFVKSLRDIAFYRKVFWGKENITSHLVGYTIEEQSFIAFCLEFIKESKTTLSIPILARYFFEIESKENGKQNFLNAIKAFCAFLIIRRGISVTTDGIDTDFRKIMSSGHRKVTSSSGGLKRYGDSHEVLESLSTEMLQEYFRSFLKITDRKEWIKKVSRQSFYGKANAILKFMFFVAHHKTNMDEACIYNLEKDSRSPHDLLTYEAWVSEKYGTIEHIAPQNRKETKDDWDAAIYDDNWVHTLGNLVLIPSCENLALSNYPWKVKKVYFKAYTAKTSKGVDDVISEAAAEGISFTKKSKECLQKGVSLSMLNPVVNHSNIWNSETIKTRSESIANLVWEEISLWLALDK